MKYLSSAISTCSLSSKIRLLNSLNGFLSTYKYGNDSLRTGTVQTNSDYRLTLMILLVKADVLCVKNLQPRCGGVVDSALTPVDFRHCGTASIEIAVFVPCRFQTRFQFIDFNRENRHRVTFPLHLYCILQSCDCESMMRFLVLSVPYCTA